MQSEFNPGARARVDDVLITAELERRPARAPDLAAENRAMAALARQLATDPYGVPQKLAELLVELCRADSAGISLLEGEGGREVFRWHAAAGAFAPQLGGSIARDDSPCGLVVERESLALFRDVERVYPAMRGFEPRMYENLLAPWVANGKAVGTVWVISQSPDRRFDAEDARLLRNLAAFAAGAYQAIASLEETARHNQALRAGEKRYRDLLTFIPAAVYACDADGAMTFHNARALALWGRVPEPGDRDWGRRGAWRTCLPDGTPLAPGESPVASVLATGDPVVNRELKIGRPDGSAIDVLVNATALRDHEGAVTGAVNIFQDITERKRAEQALQDAAHRKDEFLAMLAHELRNPLAPISNAVQLLRRPDGRRKADRLIEMVGRQVHQIVKLVDDLLEISRITSGKIELEKRPVRLAEVVAAAVETSRPQIDQARHTLEVDLPDEPLTLDADPVRLTQVLANLLNNAARYTDPGGHIALSARRDGDQVRLAVRDDGIGIPPEQLPQIFDMFTQVHRSIGRGHGGLGIGLAMVRNLVQLHGGSVEAHSAGAGQGSEFIVRLPLPLPLPLAREAQRAGADAQAPDAPKLPLSGLRVLVVDDNRDAAESLGMLLDLDGAAVSVVHDGRAALLEAAASRPDVVLLDLGMPGMDGFEVARRLRLDPRLAGVRIAALTGWGQESDRARTREAGFDYHLTKPVDLKLLENWLHAGGRPAGKPA